MIQKIRPTDLFCIGMFLLILAFGIFVNLTDPRSPWASYHWSGWLRLSITGVVLAFGAVLLYRMAKEAREKDY